MTTVKPTLETKNGYIVCTEVHEGHDPGHMWCSRIQKAINEAVDGELIQPGDNLVIPIFPSQDIWVQVLIDEDTIGKSALMDMRYTPDLGREVIVQLGFWNPGEGRKSIRSVILDYIKSRVDPKQEFKANAPIVTKCPNGAHSLKAARILKEQHTLQWNWQCLWHIVMEKACTPCIEETAAYSDDNFGLGGVETDTKPAWRK